MGKYNCFFLAKTQQIGSIPSILSILQAKENFNFYKVLSPSPQSLDMLSLMVVFSIPNITPEMVQRMYMAKNVLSPYPSFSPFFF